MFFHGYSDTPQAKKDYDANLIAKQITDVRKSIRKNTFGIVAGGLVGLLSVGTPRILDNLDVSSGLKVIPYVTSGLSGLVIGYNFNARSRKKQELGSLENFAEFYADGEDLPGNPVGGTQ